MKQTAVEWLVAELRKYGSPVPRQDEEHAKEMEKQKQDKFAIDFYNWYKSKDAEDLLHDLIMVGEIDKNVTIQKLLEIFKNK